MTFTNKDLKEMLETCTAQLENLGYTVLPVKSIKFTKKLKSSYGAYRPDKSAYFDPASMSFENKAVHITINDELSDLADEYKCELQTLVMHETIHAIEAPDSETFGFNTPHGDRYDKIKNAVENTYGYIGIDDEYHHGFTEKNRKHMLPILFTFCAVFQGGFTYKIRDFLL